MVWARLLLALVATFGLTGCAGLMMHVDELSETNANLTLKSGAQVHVQVADPKEALKGESGPSTKDFAARLEKKLSAELADDGVKTADKAPTQINIKITRFERGNAFLRGFFPFFGLGASHFDGEVTLVTKAGKRKILVEKVGQKSGIFNMGDQTDENMGYFATVVASELAKAEKPEKKSKKDKDKDS